MNWDDFAHFGADAAAWAANYHKTLGERPVRAPLTPGTTGAQIPPSPPEQGEGMAAILADFERIIMPAMTHWQHPRFFAYFPANATPPSVLAEWLVAAIAPQCMIWQTSPAGTELETAMMDWLRQGVGLPDRFKGVIQDSASSATLAATLVMRERATGWQGNAQGVAQGPRLRVYATAEVHTSIDRAIWISGIGAENLVRIPTHGPRRSMDPAALDAAIRADLAAGYTPAGVIACIGGTGVGACDSLAEVIAVAHAHNLYVHVDAAWAGSAMICPEFRDLWAGVEQADSVVFNPHKWLGAQFDCSAHFVAEPELLVKTLAIQPEYLKTHGADGIINYSEWSIPLGRRFRSLKLWFLMRAYGMEGLRQVLRGHVAWAQDLAEKLRKHPKIEIVTEPVLSLFSFRLKGADEAAQIDWLKRINDDGRIYLTPTKVDGAMVLRFQAGAFAMTERDAEIAYEVITALA